MVYRQTPRSEAVRAASRERILDAARVLFGRKGYDATTMQDIVTEADTSIGNAYFYFKNKESLMLALTERSTHALFDAAVRATASLPDGPERIAGMIAINVSSMLASRRGLAQLLSTDQRLGTLRAMGDVVLAKWIPVLSAGLPGRPAKDLPLIAAAIWGANRAVVERVTDAELGSSSRRIVEFLIRWVLRALEVPASNVDGIVRSSWRFAQRHARPDADFW